LERDLILELPNIKNKGWIMKRATVVILSGMCATGCFFGIGEKAEEDGGEGIAAMALLGIPQATNPGASGMANAAFVDGILGKVFMNAGIRFRFEKSGNNFILYYTNEGMPETNTTRIVSEITKGNCPGTYSVTVTSDPGMPLIPFWNASYEASGMVWRYNDCSIGGTWIEE
jgi:hypothetical protein